MAVRVFRHSVVLDKRPLPLKRLHGSRQHLAPVLGFLCGVPAVFGDDGMVTMHGMGADNLKIEVLVLRSLQSWLEASDTLNDVTAKHGHTWWADEIET